MGCATTRRSTLNYKAGALRGSALCSLVGKQYREKDMTKHQRSKAKRQTRKQDQKSREIEAAWESWKLPEWRSDLQAKYVRE